MGYLNSGPWSDEDVDLASEMWKAGDSAAVIADAVGRSRSAVLGFAHRNQFMFPPKSGPKRADSLACAGRTKRMAAAPKPGGQQTRRAFDAIREATSGEGITLPETKSLREDLAEAATPPRRSGVARSISCQAVAIAAPMEELIRAVRLGMLPEDAAPVSYDDIGECQCRWPVDLSVSERCPAADKACGAPVIDPVSRIAMARSHCAFHFRAAGQDIGKVTG